MTAQFQRSQGHQSDAVFWTSSPELASEKIIASYVEAYERLYERQPKQLDVLDSEWVIVNGARIHISDLAYLTTKLNQEYQQTVTQKRGVVLRLISWLKGT